MNFKHLHPLGILALTMAIMVCSSLLISVLGLLFAMPLFQLKWAGVVQILNNQLELSGASFLRYNLAVQSVGLFIVPGVVLNYLLRDKETNYFAYNKPIYWLTGLLLFSTIFFALPLVNKVLEWNMGLQLPQGLAWLEDKMQFWEQNAGQLMNKLLITNNKTIVFVNVLVIALIPAIGEEFIFRGVLQTTFLRWFKNAHLAILLTACIFSFIHFQFYGFVPRVLLGLYFGYLFYWYSNIWVAVLAHFINNALAVATYYLFAENVIHTNPDNIEFNGWQLVVGMAMVTITIFVSWKYKGAKTK